MSEPLFVRELPNGMAVLGEPMEQVSSASMAVVVPCGAARDPAGAEGAAAVATEWFLRGAGGRDTRRLNDALDALGCHHTQSVHSEHVVFTAAQLGRNLPDVLAIYGDILRRPRLEDRTFEPCRALTGQDLASLDDEPAQKCGVLLREKFYPHPLGRCVYGRAESLQDLTGQAVRRHVQGTFGPHGTILAAAGQIDWPAVCDHVERLFGDWTGPPADPVETQPPENGTTHIEKDSAQVHIALAHRSVPASHGHYYAARLAETVLSGGMSSRLFTEVREKRALAYHVAAYHHCLKRHAGMFTYAGTRPELAQETFDVTVGELRRLAEGIEPEELARARTQLKSALVMQGESTSARAGALAGDWYHLGRPRSLREISEAIDKVTGEEVAAYLNDFPARDSTVLVIGPAPLDTGAIDG